MHRDFVSFRHCDGNWAKTSDVFVQHSGACCFSVARVADFSSTYPAVKSAAAILLSGSPPRPFIRSKRLGKLPGEAVPLSLPQSRGHATRRDWHPEPLDFDISLASTRACLRCTSTRDRQAQGEDILSCSCCPQLLCSQCCVSALDMVPDNRRLLQGWLNSAESDGMLLGASSCQLCHCTWPLVCIRDKEDPPVHTPRSGLRSRHHGLCFDNSGELSP